MVSFGIHDCISECSGCLGSVCSVLVRKRVVSLFFFCISQKLSVTITVLLFTNKWMRSLPSEGLCGGGKKGSKRCLNGIAFIASLVGFGIFISAVVVGGLIFGRVILWDANLDMPIVPAVLYPPLVFQALTLFFSMLFAMYTLIGCCGVISKMDSSGSSLFMGIIAFFLVCASVARVAVLALLLSGYFLELSVQFFAGLIFPEAAQWGCMLCCVFVWLFLQRKRRQDRHFRFDEITGDSDDDDEIDDLKVPLQRK